jgi:hypothetical protein
MLADSYGIPADVFLDAVHEAYITSLEETVEDAFLVNLRASRV